MTSDKQILKLFFQFSWKTAVVTVACIALCAVVPRFSPEDYIYFLDIPVFIAMQILSSAVITAYFFNGLTREDKLKVFFTIFAATALSGTIANLSANSIRLAANDNVMVDFITFGVINAAAALLTLSMTRLKKISVDRVAEDGVSTRKANKLEELALKTRPIVVSVLVLLLSTAFALIPPEYFVDANFAVTVPFFFYMQMLMTLVLTYFCFNSLTGKEKYRAYFTILSLALLLGAIANWDHAQFTPRVGGRVLVSSVSFVTMNLGGLLTVLIFYRWRDYLKNMKARFEGGSA